MIEIKNRFTGKTINKDETARRSMSFWRRANLRDANLSEPLTPEQYAQRAVEYRERHPEVPVVPLLDATICKIVNSGEGALDMRAWHTCKTTHCRAGWAVHLAGEAGYELEKKYDPERAGLMIYQASTGYVPNFFASDKVALADICTRGDQSAQRI